MSPRPSSTILPTGCYVHGRESLHGAHYLELLLGIVNEAESQGPLEASACRELLQTLIRLLREMNTAPGMTWTLAHHMAVLRVLVGCRTGKANAYFVQNVLRKFKWTDEAIVVLYREYKLHPDVNSWAEHTKRALIWAARYNVRVSETTRRLIEEDYEVIGVQMRTTQELMTFAYRSKSEEKQRADPSAQLPNPVMDRVVHAAAVSRPRYRVYERIRRAWTMEEPKCRDRGERTGVLGSSDVWGNTSRGTTRSGGTAATRCAP